MIDLDALQNEISTWANTQFGNRTKEDSLITLGKGLGVVVSWKLEEIVPLLHVVRQFGQICQFHNGQFNHNADNIEFHDEKLKDALGDVMIFLLDYCTLREWSYEDIIRKTWTEIKNRESTRI